MLWGKFAAMSASAKVATGVVATLGLGAAVGGVAYATTAQDDTHGTVVRVIDGDTIVARIAGDEETVRLLNIDTPETKDPNEPVQCLGPEASDYLAALLAPGDRIDLAYDVERTDRYGRTLANVYESQKLVNAEIVAAGLGVAVLFEPNSRFYDEVLQAQRRAQENQSGLFDAAVDCTVPGGLQPALDELAALPAFAPTTAEDAAGMIGTVAAALVAGKVAGAALNAIDPRSDAVRAAAYAADGATWKARLDQGVARATAQQQSLKKQQRTLAATEKKAADEAKKEAAAKKKAAAQKKAAAERKAAAEAAAQRQAAEAAAARKAAAQRATEQKAAATRAAESAAARAEAARSAARKPAAKPATRAPEKRSTNSYPGYTGPRCYAPGGKSWKPCG